MEIKVSRKNFYKLAQRIFTDFAEIKKGHPITVPISNHHIYINGILCFLDDDAKHYFEFNSYGQMAILKEKDGVRTHHICFDLNNLNSLRFHAQSFNGEFNEDKGVYYNESYDFTF